MAELLFGLTEGLLIKLSSQVYREISSAYGVRDDLRALESTISTIKAVLLDAEVKKIHNNEINIWLEQLQDVLYDVEDVFSEFECEELRKKLLNQQRNNREVCRFLPMQFHRSVVFNFKMAHRIKKITKRLDEIASQRQKFHLNEREVEYFPHTIRETTHSFIHEFEASQIIGRDEDKERIIQLLIHLNDHKELSIISLVGMGGLGKTTLAKLVCNDKRIKGYFGENIMWICVSIDFDVQRLTREILSAATNSEISGSLTMDQVQRKLRAELNDRKFLLVLDDVWNQNANKWNNLRQFLMVGAQGSKVLVTTRMDSIAQTMGSDEKHELREISREESWILFSKYAFVDGKEKEVREDLKRIGEEILEKCKGVPLAIRSLSSLLYSKANTREWEYIRDSEIWQLEDQKEDDILPALKLSYTLMPSHLKPCFVYCALFPKDYVYSYGQIIQLWMAQGMLHLKNENEELEDIGKRYFKELLSRCFFQDFNKNFTEHYDCTFKMHDLVHDLALSIVQGKYLSIPSESASIDENVQHLYISWFDGITTWSPVQQFQRVRSIIYCTSIDFYTRISLKWITKFKFLRVLEMEIKRFRTLSNSIGRLKHLRHLNLRKNYLLISLPNSLCKLYNLQTLILQDCFGVEAISRHIRKMISLRYLWITEKIMSRLLQGDGIEYLSNLRYLAISYSAFFSQNNNEDVSKQIVIQPKLQILHLQDLTWVAFPQWVRSFAKTLREVRIIGCHKLLTLPGWLSEASSLETLTILRCNNLSSLPQEMKNLTSLTTLRIVSCEKLNRDELPKVAHVPEVVVNG